jgi:hypothetical protein
MSTFNTLWATAQAQLFRAFGEAVTYTPKAGEAVAGVGIITTVLTNQAESPSHWANCEVSKAALGLTPAEGDVVTVDGTDYRVKAATLLRGSTDVYVLSLHKKK